MKTRIILPLMIAASISSCSESTSPEVVPPSPGASASASVVAAPVNEPITDEEASMRISPHAFTEYNTRSYPKFVAQVGSSGTRRANELQKPAAILAAKNPTCDSVEMVTASQESTRAEIRFFVDCKNQTRIYVSEADLKTQQVPLSQSQKTVDEKVALSACKAAAKAETLYPQLADMNTWRGSTFRQAPVTGNAEVLVHFKAKNALGTEIPYLARCIFPAGSNTPELTILADSN